MRFFFEEVKAKVGVKLELRMLMFWRLHAGVLELFSESVHKA